MSKPDARARAVGAANTLWYEGDELRSTNTDIEGFINNLDACAPGWDAATDALVLGAGGSARAVVFGLIERGIKRVHLVNRTIERARALADQFGANVDPVSWNAIRDLLALDVDVAALLPPDASTEGFDNIAEALGVSPSLIQGYVSAAMKISRRAVGDRTATPTQITYVVPGALSQDRHIEGLPLGTRGGMLVRHTFPLDAEYELNVTGGFFGGRGGGGGAVIDVTLDGGKIAVADPRSFRITVGAGPHTIGVALVDRVRAAGVDEAYSDFRINSVFTAAGGIQTVVITGPYNATGPGDTPSRRRIFVCRPASAIEEAPCARKIVSALARRAYRRAPLGDEVETLMGFYQQGRREGDFEGGIQQALGKWLVVDFGYFYKKTTNAYDFGVLFDTPIAFPISWDHSKLDGFTGRVNLINHGGFSAFSD